MTWLAAKALLGGLWAFLRSPLCQLLALALCAVLGLSLADARGYRRGVAANEAKWAKKLSEDAVAARKTEANNASAGNQSSVAVEKLRTVTEWRTRTIIERIPYEVPSDPARPGLPWGFIRLHDAAAVGVSEAPDRPSQPDVGPSPVTDARALEVIAENYGACRFDQGRYAELQALLKTWGMAPQ